MASLIAEMDRLETFNQTNVELKFERLHLGHSFFNF